MVKRAALQADTSVDVTADIEEENLRPWRARFLPWQERDMDRALPYFTIVADLTTLAPECSFAGDSRTVVARYHGLPFTAVAFFDRNTQRTYHDARRLARLTRRLVGPGERFVCLVAESDWPLLRDAYEVLEVHPEWQMVFRDDPTGLNHGDAVPLGDSDMSQMRALAQREEMGAFEHNPLSKGPWFGVWRHQHLVAQGGTHVCLERAAEIGNIMTAEAHRRRGYASQIVAALIREHSRHERRVFLQVLKDNEAAILFYEHLGFEKARTIFLTTCRLSRTTSPAVDSWFLSVANRTPSIAEGDTISRKGIAFETQPDPSMLRLLQI